MLKPSAFTVLLFSLASQAAAQVFPLPGRDIEVTPQLAANNPEVGYAVRQIQNIALSYSRKGCGQAPSVTVYDGTFLNNAQAAALNAALVNAMRTAASTSSRAKVLDFRWGANQFAYWTAAKSTDGLEFSITYQRLGNTFVVKCSN